MDSKVVVARGWTVVPPPPPLPHRVAHPSVSCKLCPSTTSRSTGTPTPFRMPPPPHASTPIYREGAKQEDGSSSTLMSWDAPLMPWNAPPGRENPRTVDCMQLCILVVIIGGAVAVGRLSLFCF
eukprot:TRINITY_DN24247_c0_g1_i1.p2 TRINITY_DN24247_c0_g1~~TRINITY_DN24247_c0_g1_i1.p2  ORF type:complete len:124 (-),score=6.45 TRINITY_DN24247_c0_g1_i1:48-419(-)